MIPNGLTDSDELKTRRTLNSKFFKKNKNETVMTANTGHIHYFNKLGVGDKEKRMREIDYTLQWDETRKGWYFEYNNFQPFLPEYADQWIEFRDVFDEKDQKVMYKAYANHIKGVKFDSLEGVTNTNGVLYENAFGVGRDLILYFTRTTLKKVVRIKEEVKGVDSLAFDFEIKFPNNVYRGSSCEDIAYKLEFSDDKTFDTNKETLIGDSNLKGEWATYLRSFKVWDSVEKTETINVDLILDGDKKILRKKISADFLINSEGDVFTDTTTSYYSGVGDGHVVNRPHSNWDITHDGTTGTSVNYTGVTSQTPYANRVSTSDYIIQRGFCPVDTSALPSGAVISLATLNLYLTNVSIVDNDGDDFGVLLQTSQASTSSLVLDDYDNCGAVNSPVEGSNRIDLSSLSSESYTAWTLNSTGIGWINYSGYTKLGIREGHDVLDNPVTGRNSVTWSTSEEVSNNPYLEITYTEPGGADTGFLIMF